MQIVQDDEVCIDNNETDIQQQQQQPVSNDLNWCKTDQFGDLHIEAVQLFFILLYVGETCDYMYLMVNAHIHVMQA